MKTYNYIYLITNTLNGKIYVGKHSTDNLNDGYMGSGKLIRLAYNKYGIENFTKQILHFADTEEELNDLEIFYIKDLDARNRGYNLTDGGDGTLGCQSPNKGKRLSDEAKRKLSESLKGRTSPNKGKSTWNKGKVGVQQAWNKGKKIGPMTEEHKRKISEAGKGKKHGPLSEETKRKISETLKRKKEAI